MTRSVGSRLPEDLVALLGRREVSADEGLTLVLTTPGPGGWPLLALLSIGEVVAVDPTDVRLGLWSSSSTTASLAGGGLATLSLVHRGAAWDVRLRCEPGPDLVVDGGGRLASFRCRVVEVLEDRVGYAELVDGIRFRLTRPEQVVPRWAWMREELRRLEPPSPTPGASAGSPPAG